ncbi:MAG: UDP-3-O-(3-hydroxymyristoyl)glucosamine N-acyltransferase, partial [Pyrinomonadaceae bacterium]|nr:UDP-3-O-(3-hydroxymyristoyl)glucosamine N-acyltransferase [Sphingobacteriaceae bacterium]
MQFTAQQIGILLNGTVDGDPDVTVNQLAKIEEATAGSLSFLANKKYENYLYQTGASIVIVDSDFIPTSPYTCTLIRVSNAYSAFSVLLDQYNTLKRDKTGIEQPSFIHSSAKLGKNVYVGAFAYIGADAVIGDNTKIYPQVYIGDNVHIGDNSTFFPGVKIYYDSKIGNNVTIHSSTVIGSDGFGFAPQA